MAAAPVTTRPAPVSADAGESGRAPGLFFLLGAGKSGTNWAGRVLNLHPRIFVDGEFHFEFFYEAFARFTGADWQVGHRPAVRTEARAALNDLVRRTMLAAARGRPGLAVVGDRSPRWFQVLVPGAPHIYMIRDGRDVLVSHMFNYLRVILPEHVPDHLRAPYLENVERFKANPLEFGPENPGLLGNEEWVRHFASRWAEQLRHDLQRIEQYREGPLRSPVLQIRYEVLHKEPEATRAAMYRFLGMDPSEAAPLSTETATTPGFGREDRTKFNRKGAVGDWRNFATDKFRRWVKEKAGSTLIELGYERDMNW